MKTASHFATVNGNRVHYVDVGSGPTLLLLHGNPTSSLVWQGVIDRLSSSFRCVAPDYPGFGRSTGADDYTYTVREHAAVVAGLVEQLDLRDYVVAMQDWGGPIGITAAAQDPARVRGLVVANTWAWPVNGDPRFEIASRLMGGPVGRLAITRLNLFVKVVLPMGHRLRKLTDDEMTAYREAMSTATSRRAAAALPAAILGERSLLADAEEAVKRFAERPSLIVWADKDIAFQGRELERWRRLLPTGTVVPVPGAGHFVQSDAPEAVAAAIQSSFG